MLSCFLLYIFLVSVFSVTIFSSVVLFCSIFVFVLFCFVLFVFLFWTFLLSGGSLKLPKQHFPRRSRSFVAIVSLPGCHGPAYLTDRPACTVARSSTRTQRCQTPEPPSEQSRNNMDIRPT